MGRMVALVTAAAVSAGCSAAPETAPSADAPVATAQAPATTPSLSPKPAPALRDFPRPRDLGAGWSYRIDPGDPEAGYDGTGTPQSQRDPAEVAALAVPLGCPRSTLPLARRATEVDYSFRGRPVVAIRLVFSGVEQAADFVDLRREALRSCIGLSGGPAVGPYVVHLGAAVNDRTPESEPWTELVVRRAAAVLLVAAAGSWEDSPLEAATWRRLVSGA